MPRPSAPGRRLHPSWTGLGAGRLLAVVEARACALGLPEIRLCANAMMGENQRLHPKFGYQVVGRRVGGPYGSPTTGSTTQTTRPTSAKPRILDFCRCPPGRLGSAVRPPGAGDVLPHFGALRRGGFLGFIPHPAGFGFPQRLVHGHTAHVCLLVPTWFRDGTEVDLSREGYSSNVVCQWPESRFGCQWQVSLWAT